MQRHATSRREQILLCDESKKWQTRTQKEGLVRTGLVSRKCKTKTFPNKAQQTVRKNGVGDFPDSQRGGKALGLCFQSLELGSQEETCERYLTTKRRSNFQRLPFLRAPFQLPRTRHSLRQKGFHLQVLPARTRPKPRIHGADMPCVPPANAPG